MVGDPGIICLESSKDSFFTNTPRLCVTVIIDWSSVPVRFREIFKVQEIIEAIWHIQGLKLSVCLSGDIKVLPLKASDSGKYCSNRLRLVYTRVVLNMVSKLWQNVLKCSTNGTDTADTYFGLCKNAMIGKGIPEPIFDPCFHAFLTHLNIILGWARTDWQRVWCKPAFNLSGKVIHCYQ